MVVFFAALSLDSSVSGSNISRASGFAAFAGFLDLPGLVGASFSSDFVLLAGFLPPVFFFVDRSVVVRSVKNRDLEGGRNSSAAVGNDDGVGSCGDLFDVPLRSRESCRTSFGGATGDEDSMIISAAAAILSIEKIVSPQGREADWRGD